jgi:hypothetical protein
VSKTETVDASFSMLVMSVASSAAMALGLTPHPQSGKVEKDKDMARFNIDLLLVLKEKTKNNLSKEETELLDHLLNDLQLKFVQFK